jgi:hypothetical protein
MSNLWVNIRFGTRHFQIVKGFKGVSFKVNPYCIENPPRTKVEVFELFGWSN